MNTNPMETSMSVSMAIAFVAGWVGGPLWTAAALWVLVRLLAPMGWLYANTALHFSRERWAVAFRGWALFWGPPELPERSIERWRWGSLSVRSTNPVWWAQVVAREARTDARHRAFRAGLASKVIDGPGYVDDAGLMVVGMASDGSWWWLRDGVAECAEDETSALNAWCDSRAKRGDA